MLLFIYMIYVIYSLSKMKREGKKSLYFYEDCRLWFIGFIIDYDVFQVFGIFIFPFAIFWFSSLSCSW